MPMTLTLAVAVLLALTSLPHAAAAQSAAPAANMFTLDPDGSQVGFTVYAQKFFKLKKEGHFKGLTGQLDYDVNRPAATHVDLTVFTATVDMHDAAHEALLRSGDFFDVVRFPTMHFASTDTAFKHDGSLEVTGDLTIRDITRRIVLPVTIRPAQGAGNRGSTFETSFQIDRTEFGLTGTPKLAFNVSIAKTVRIFIALATRRTLASPAR